MHLRMSKGEDALNDFLNHGVRGLIGIRDFAGFR